MTRLAIAVVFALVPLVAAARDARAEVDPWKQGVSPATMATAKALLEAGNVLLLEHEYAAALAKYTEAVHVWDHPAIRFNMVRCEIQLGRMVEASENLERALRYGAAPLEDTVYNEALAYQKLLANQTADVTVACSQPGVDLTLDGQPVVVCPGSTSQRVLPGRHQVVGKRAGMITRTTELFVLGGKPERVTMSLEPFVAKPMVIEHRWRTWVPWAVFGGGFLTAGVGGLLRYTATGTSDEYYQRTDHDCRMPCPPDYLSSVKQRAELESRVGVATIVVGAGVVATGAVLLYLNRARSVYPKERVSLIPTARGVAVLGRF